MTARISGKASLRVLRFLESAKVTEMLSFGAGSEERIMLYGSNGRKMLVAEDVLGALNAAALVSIQNKRCSLHENGRRKLKRMAGDVENFADQHRAQRVCQVKIDGAVHAALVNENESPLTRLRNRKKPDGQPWLDDDHVAAGERLRRDFTLGQLMQKVTASWDAGIGSTKAGRGGNGDLADNAIDARNRLDKALSIVGPDLAGVLTDVCCFLKGLESVERERRWPPRSAKLMLRVGLELLSHHYGTKAGSNRSGKMLHWGDQNYRPAIGS